ALRRALRQQLVRQSERVHPHREARGAVGARSLALAAHPPRRDPRRAARGERTAQLAARDEGGACVRRALRRHRQAFLAVLCAGLAAVLVLLALDAKAWRTTISRDDLRFR